MTPSEQLAKRILEGGLPMLAQYVAEVTLRLDEMAADKPEPPLCPGCRKPYDSPDHDPRCSSCAESGTGSEPVKPADGPDTRVCHHHRFAAACYECKAEVDAELAKVTAERDTLRARVAALSVGLEDAVSAHNENMTRSFDSDMVLRAKLKTEQSAHEATKRELEFSQGERETSNRIIDRLNRELEACRAAHNKFTGDVSALISSGTQHEPTLLRELVAKYTKGGTYGG